MANLPPELERIDELLYQLFHLACELEDYNDCYLPHDSIDSGVIPPLSVLSNGEPASLFDQRQEVERKLTLQNPSVSSLRQRLVDEISLMTKEKSQRPGRPFDMSGYGFRYSYHLGSGRYINIIRLRYGFRRYSFAKIALVLHVSDVTIRNNFREIVQKYLEVIGEP